MRKISNGLMGALLLASGCSGGGSQGSATSPGAETSPCVDGLCLGSLECLSNVCVDLGEDTTPSSDPSDTDPITTDPLTTDPATGTTSASGTSMSPDNTGTTTAAGDTTDGTSTTATDSTSTSTTGGMQAVCGDATKAGDEQCDDGNNLDGDGCSGACVAEPIKFAVITAGPPISAVFRVYNINDWTYTHVNGQPALGNSLVTVAVSNQHAYVLSDKVGGVYRYGLYTGEWTSYAPTPPALKNTAGFMEWVGNGVCLGYWSVPELHCYDGSKWRKIMLSISPDRVAAWDPATNQLYIKGYKQWGFQVVDLDTDQIVNTVVGAVNNSTQVFGAYSNGYFYVADATHVYKINVQGGGLLDTKMPLPGSYNSGDFHPDKGTLYVFSDNFDDIYHTMTEYDPLSGVSQVINAELLYSGFSTMMRFQRSAAE